MLCPEQFAANQDLPCFTRAGSLHMRPSAATATTSMRPRSVSAGTRTAAAVMQQSNSPYLQRISSKSSPLLNTLASSKKAENFENKPQIQANMTGSRYKTELCRSFQESGMCKYGDRCQFAHGVVEVRTVVRHPKYKTELCRTFHSSGFCPYGPRCHFVHNPDEAREAAKAFKLKDGKKSDSPPTSPLVDSGISSPSENEVFSIGRGTTVKQETIDPVFVFPGGASDDCLKTRSEPELGCLEMDSPLLEAFSSARTSPIKFSSTEAKPEAASLPENNRLFKPIMHKSCSLEEAVTSGLQQLHINSSPYSGVGYTPYTYYL